jgi:hypothetical protein
VKHFVPILDEDVSLDRSDRSIRLLVTGSRTWPWAKVDMVREALDAAVAFLTSGRPAGVPVTLVSGACPRGVDAIAEAYAVRSGWNMERFPADWGQYKRSAGHIRNQAMADAGADICVALVWGEHSPGTRDMIRRARRAGIFTVVHEGGGET